MKKPFFFLFLIGLGLSISLFFVHLSQAQKIGEDINFSLPQIPSIEDLGVVELIPSAGLPQAKFTAQLEDVIQFPTLPMLELEINEFPNVESSAPEKEKNVFSLSEINKFFEILRQNIKEGAKNIKLLITPKSKPVQQPSSQVVQQNSPQVVRQSSPRVVQQSASTQPVQKETPPLKPETATVVQTIIREPQIIYSPASDNFNNQLEDLRLTISQIKKDQKIQTDNLLRVIGENSKINSLGYVNEPSKLIIQSPTLVAPVGISDADIPNDITVETTRAANFSNDVTITGRFLRVGSTITVDGVKNLISSSDGLTLIPAGGNPLTTSYLNATSTATSTFSGPISATTTTADGRLIVSGATTTGELWLNPYAQFGGGVHIASSSPSTNLATSGLGFNVSTSSYFGYNVGIGTTSPTEQLSVANQLIVGGSSTSTFQGNVNVRGNLAIGTLCINCGGGGGFSGGTTTVTNLIVTNVSTSTFAGGLAVQTDKFVVDNQTGNVGIGTTTPGVAFSVAGRGIFDQDVRANYFTGTSTTATSTFLGAVGVGTSTPAEQLATAGRLYVGGTGTSTIENNLQVRGALKIGVTSAYISDTGISAANDFTISTVGAENHLALQTMGRVGVSSSTPWGVLSVERNGANAEMPIFVVSEQGTSSPYLIVNALGKTGVGTTSPSAKLAVAGDVLAGGFHITGAGTSSLAAIEAASTTIDGRLVLSGATTTGEVWINPYARLGGGGVHIASSSPDRVGLLAGGVGFSVSTTTYFGDKVGIGTTSPTRALSIYGDANVSGLLNVGSLTTAGNFAAPSLLVGGVFASSTSAFTGLSTFYGGLLVNNATSTITELVMINSTTTNATTTTAYFSGSTTVAGVFNAGHKSSVIIGYASTTGLTVSDQLIVTNRVGIGTTTPSAKLAVAGDVLAGGFHVTGAGTSSLAAIEAASTTIDGRLILSGATTTGEVWINPYGGKVHIASSSPDRVNLVAGGFGFSVSTTSYFGGKVGFGAMAPGIVTPGTFANVEVYKATNIGASGSLGVIDTTAQAAGTGGSIIFGGLFNTESVTTNAIIRAEKTNSTDQNYSFGLAFYTRNSGSTAARNMVISNLGQVGIGTATPSAKLAVAGDVLAGNFNVTGAGTSTFATIEAASTTVDGRLILSGATTTGEVWINPYAVAGGGVHIASSSPDRSNLLSVGVGFTVSTTSYFGSSVGIGTTSPQVSNALGVGGNLYVFGSTIAGTTTVSNLIIGNLSTSTFAGPIESSAADGRLVIHGATTTGELWLNPYGGTVGIGIGSTSISAWASTSQLFIPAKTPKFPIGKASTGSASDPLNVYVQDKYAYVINGSSVTLQIFNVSTSSPALVSTTAMGASPYAVNVQGRYAYTVGGDGGGSLNIYDVSNPFLPALVASTTTDVRPLDLYVQGRYAYVINSTSATLQIFDVSNPSSPVIVGSVATGATPRNIYVKGRYAYVTNYTAAGALQVFDVSNPAAPSLSGSAVAGNSPRDVYVQDGYAYVVIYNAGLFRIFNVSTSSPSLIGSISMPYPSGVSVQGKYAYVTNQTSNILQIVDISNPYSPFVTGSSTPIGTTPEDIYVQGRYAYTVSTGSDTLQITDLGGVYVQQLEVGGLETSYLRVKANLAVSNDLDVKGGLVVGQNLSVQGPFAVTAGNGLATTSALVVQPFSGNVGIGTSTPNNRLQVMATTSPQLLLTDMNGTANLKHVYASSSAGDLAFGTLTDNLATYTERLRITNAGRVGIGTTSPNAKLAVVGDILATQFNVSEVATSTFANIEAASTTVDGRLILSGATTTGEVWINPYGGKVHIASSSPDRVNIVSGGVGFSVSTTTYFGGKVGFGGTAPGTFADVEVQKKIATGASGGFGVIDTTAQAAGTGGSIIFGGYYNTESVTTNAIIRAEKTNATDNDYSFGLAFYTRNSGFSAARNMVISNLGQVGIGTSTPTAKLAVAGDILAGNFNVTGAGTSTFATIEAASTTVDGRLILSGATTTGEVWINPYAVAGGGVHIASSSPDRSNLLSVGVGFTVSTSSYFGSSVGIGTTSPQVSNALGVGGNLYVFGSAITGTTTVSNLIVGNISTSTFAGGLTIQTDKLVVDNFTGNVGIGTTSPYTKLSVAGQIAAEYFTATSTATSTFGGPIASNAADGRLIIHGATTTGELWLNPYGGTVGVGIASTSISSWASSTQLFIPARTPKAPSGEVTSGTNAQAINLYVQGEYAFIANNVGNTVEIFHVATSSPTLVGSMSLVNPWSVYVQGRYAYTVSGVGAGSLNIYDISNPFLPALVASTTAGTLPVDVYVQGRYAYVINYTSATLQIFDVSNPSSPVVVGSVATGATPRDIYVKGRYAYVTNYTGAGALQVFDVSNPAAPSLSGSVVTGSSPRGVQVQNGYAYVAVYAAGNIRIFNVSTSSPSLVGSVSTGGNPSEVFVQGRYAYVVDQTLDALLVLDVSRPSSPIIIGSVSTGAINPNAVFVQGKYAYVVNNSGNFNHLMVFDLGGAYIQQLETGGIETSSLLVKGNLLANNDIDIKGGLVVGQSLSVQGPFAVTSGNGLATTSALVVQPSSGNVGIGTSTPNNRLQVMATTSPQLLLTDMNGTANLKHVYASSSAGDLAFGTLTDNLVTYTERLRITNAGRVGIGTTSPNAKLAVAGDVLATQFIVSEVGTSTFANIEAASTTVDGRLILSGATTTGEIWINPYAVAGGGVHIASSSPDRANLLSVGVGFTVSTTSYFGSSVGIGTTSPQVSNALGVGGNLYVRGSTGFGGIAYTWPAADGSSGQFLSTNGAGVLSWASGSGGGWTDAGVTVGLAANTDNVGIGTSTPSAKLTVWGNSTGANSLANFVNSASTTVFTALENGAVGVGTTSPTLLGANTTGLAVSGSLYVSGSTTVSELKLSGEGLDKSMGSTTPAINTLYKENVVKAWISFRSNLTPALIRDAFNVSSLTDTATGDVTVNWQNSFLTNNYSVVASGNTFSMTLYDETPSSIRTLTRDSAAASNDTHLVSVIAIGDQ